MALDASPVTAFEKVQSDLCPLSSWSGTIVNAKAMEESCPGVIGSYNSELVAGDCIVSLFCLLWASLHAGTSLILFPNALIVLFSAQVLSAEVGKLDGWPFLVGDFCAPLRALCA